MWCNNVADFDAGELAGQRRRRPVEAGGRVLMFSMNAARERPDRSGPSWFASETSGTAVADLCATTTAVLACTSRSLTTTCNFGLPSGC